jgi:hypothetical protein
MHDLRRGYVELHGQLMLRLQNSRHIDHHRAQKLRGVKVELCGDTESSQICGDE